MDRERLIKAAHLMRHEHGALWEPEDGCGCADWIDTLLANYEDLTKALRLPRREIGYTAEECERDMRRLTGGERGCSNPDEHLMNLHAHD